MLLYHVATQVENPGARSRDDARDVTPSGFVGSSADAMETVKLPWADSETVLCGNPRPETDRVTVDAAVARGTTTSVRPGPNTRRLRPRR